MAPLHHRFWPKGVPHDVRVPRVTLVDYLEVAARRYPDKPAIVYGGATTDYRSLRARVDALAAYLQQRCVALQTKLRESDAAVDDEISNEIAAFSADFATLLQRLKAITGGRGGLPGEPIQELT